jgi:hypothetical protein
MWLSPVVLISLQIAIAKTGSVPLFEKRRRNHLHIYLSGRMVEEDYEV